MSDAGGTSRLRIVGRRVALALIAGYALVCLGFALAQDRLLYFPARVSAADEPRLAEALGARRVASRHGDTLGYLAPSEGPSRATWIVAHGNGGLALGQRRFVDLARSGDAGYDVFLVEYPGYGARRGAPGQARNVAATLEAIDRFDDGPVVLVGESLGSAVVALAAARRHDAVSAVVLITPLPRLAGPARHHYPFLPTFLLRDRYEADTALDHFGGPAAFVVAGRDEVIPAQLALAMYRGYRGPKTLLLEPDATHGTVDYAPSRPSWRAVHAFVARALAH